MNMVCNECGLQLMGSVMKVSVMKVVCHEHLSST